MFTRFTRFGRTRSVRSVAKEGSVDASVPGDYTLSYSVTDAHGNTTTAQRIVHVLSSENYNARTIYLTFDDGPGPYTDQLLDILDQYNVKATFFVTADTSGKYEEVYRRIVNEGHTIAMDSYSNSYSKIYESTQSFTEDLTEISGYISNLTGVTPQIYRFPGGSMNQISNVDMVDLVKILNSKNITYYDWNVNSGDTAEGCTTDNIVSNVTSGIAKYNNSVVLLHDDSNSSTTAEAIGPLIDALNNMGAEILPIDDSTYKVQYIKADSVGQ